MQEFFFIFHKSVLKPENFSRNGMQIGNTFWVHISNKLHYLGELSFWEGNFWWTNYFDNVTDIRHNVFDVINARDRRQIKEFPEWSCRCVKNPRKWPGQDEIIAKI